jgi:hypothetical protein
VNGTNQQAARNDRGAMEVRGTISGRLGNTLADRPPAPAPALIQLLNRMEETNSRMIEKLSCIRDMNDRLFGSNPETANETKLPDSGAIVQQLERQIMTYELLVTSFGVELERLSLV